MEVRLSWQNLDTERIFCLIAVAHKVSVSRKALFDAINAVEPWWVIEIFLSSPIAMLSEPLYSSRFVGSAVTWCVAPESTIHWFAAAWLLERKFSFAYNDCETLTCKHLLTANRISAGTPLCRNICTIVGTPLWVVVRLASSPVVGIGGSVVSDHCSSYCRSFFLQILRIN